MKNKKIAIIGFGIEGKDAFRYFSKRGNEIQVFDKADKKEIDLSRVEIADNQLNTGKNYLHNGFNDFDIIFRSAGVRPDIPQIEEAKKKGIKVTTTIGYFFEQFSGKIIGVTGTKGKGTTSTLIYEILRKQGLSVKLAGNIGIPVLDILDSGESPDWCVLELSSFQLMDIKTSPHVAVVLNITLDHLDWHIDKEEYVQSKQNIVRFQTNDDYAVLNHDYNNSKKFAEFGSSQKYYFSKNKRVIGSYVDDNKIWVNVGKPKLIGQTDDLELRGEHNWENISAAITASYLAGANLKSIRSAVFSFKGLEHRLEFVREVQGIKFYNDSFSTTTHTTLAAINSFKEDITLILGGYDKGLNYQELVNDTAKKNNLENIILIGDIGERYENWYQEAGYQGKIINIGYADMETIVKQAIKITEPEGIILLSPSTSSFDMFENYKKRGEAFKKAVNEL